MRFNRKKIALPLCLSLLGLHTALAEPVQRSQIAADAAWFLHLDLDRLKPTQLGQYLLGELEKPEAQGNFAAFQAMFNFDPRKKLKAGTLYSRGAAPEDAVLLLTGEFDAERLVTVAKAGQDYQSSQHRTYTIHEWIDALRPARRGVRPRSYGAIHTNGVVVLGQKSDRVADALDVLDKFQDSLEKTKTAMPSGTASASAFLVAVARPADLARIAPQAAMLQQLKTLSLSAAEAENQLAVELRLDAQNEDAAKNVLTISQGLLAMAAMQGNQAPWAKWLQGISTTQTNASVTTSLKLPAAEVIQMLKSAPTRRGPRPR